MNGGSEPVMEQITDREWVVRCADHNLHRRVETQAHATNLLALHLRKDHPGPTTGPATLDLTAAAALVVVIHADPIMGDLAKTTARNVWTCLTGLEGEAALAYARTVAAHQTTAVIPPF